MSFFLRGMQYPIAQLRYEEVIELDVLDQSSLSFSKSGVGFHKKVKCACLIQVFESPKSDEFMLNHISDLKKKDRVKRGIKIQKSYFRRI